MMRILGGMVAATMVVALSAAKAGSADVEPSTGTEQGVERAKRLCRGGHATQSSASADTLFGHFPFAPAAPATLTSTPRGFSGAHCARIHRDAAGPLRALIAAAHAEDPHVGRDLIGLSCHRSSARQVALYCNGGAIARRGHAEHARWVAPPGYSEHATGLAVDFGSRSRPGCNLEPCFANTRTGQWLAANAPRFGFEMSFRQGNAQGIAFEPWHFRYVGQDKAHATFTHARLQTVATDHKPAAGDGAGVILPENSEASTGFVGGALATKDDAEPE